MIPDLQRVVLEVFGGCNYACKMCPQTTGRDKMFTRKMPLPLFESILDKVAQYGNPIINLEGSGEPTMAPDLPLYVDACTKRNLKSYMYCNGANLHGQYMKDVVDAGLDFVRFSCIGYNKETYNEWMSTDNFDLIKTNMNEMQEYIKETNSSCEVSSYHLILDNENAEFETEQYIKNIIEPANSIGYIWKMHNWSGNLPANYSRLDAHRRSCGRPFAPELTVRAGGNNGKRAAVTPCCQTMGPPNEAKSVLGHLQDQTLEEIWNGDLYNNLREAHRTEDFDSIDYCKDCDFLINDPEVLIWSNDPAASVNHIIGTDFSLTDCD